MGVYPVGCNVSCSCSSYSSVSGRWRWCARNEGRTLVCSKLRSVLIRARAVRIEIPNSTVPSVGAQVMRAAFDTLIRDALGLVGFVDDSKCVAHSCAVRLLLSRMFPVASFQEGINPLFIMRAVPAGLTARISLFYSFMLPMTSCGHAVLSPSFRVCLLPRMKRRRRAEW